MYFIYILKSQKQINKLYIGITHNLSERLKEHNECPMCSYIKSYGPWILESYIGVRGEALAKKLEQYFKQGSGYSFLRKRLIARNKC